MNKRFMVSINMLTNEREYWDYDRRLDVCEVVDMLNDLNDSCIEKQKINKKLYDENIQLRLKLLNFHKLKETVKYLEEKGVF